MGLVASIITEFSYKEVQKNTFSLDYIQAIDACETLEDLAAEVAVRVKEMKGDNFAAAHYILLTLD